MTYIECDVIPQRDLTLDNGGLPPRSPLCNFTGRTYYRIIYKEVLTMSAPQEEKDIYIIPPNFIETGTIFGGTIKIRNALEAGILALGIGIPVIYIP
ncbi:MAG: hypothetical protein IJ940_07560, partial [Bacteroidales bacterium]|nr:hypothetical protein [Bacteroidales bacterium]